jgi:hypothetical protein
VAVRSWLVVVVIVLSSLACLLGLATSLRRALPGRLLLIAAAATGLAVIVQSAVATVHLIGGEHPSEQATTIGYLAGIVFVMPLAVVWAYADRVRSSGYVVAVAAFTCAVMTVRLVTLWQGGNV